MDCNCSVSSFLSGLNSNLNVSLDMGGGNSGGGAVSYKEPPQSRLKKLWATDPLEQNSKPGTEEPVCVCDSACWIEVKSAFLLYLTNKLPCPWKPRTWN